MAWKFDHCLPPRQDPQTRTGSRGMTPEFIEKVRRDYDAENTLDWDSYLAGYIACLKRFGTTRGMK